MTTETAPDPTVEAWSDRLEEELTEAGMEQPQAKAYRLAFELGLTRVISQTATRQELTATRQEFKDEIGSLRQELKAEIVQLRDDLRREMEVRGRYVILTMAIGFGVVTGLLSAIIAIIA